MKIEQDLDRVFKENCIKVSLRSILAEFQGLLSSITLNIITLPASAKSCHNEKSTLKPHIWISACSVVDKSDFFLSKSHEILISTTY